MITILSIITAAFTFITFTHALPARPMVRHSVAHAPSAQPHIPMEDTFVARRGGYSPDWSHNFDPLPAATVHADPVVSPPQLGPVHSARREKLHSRADTSDGAIPPYKNLLSHASGTPPVPSVTLITTFLTAPTASHSSSPVAPNTSVTLIPRPTSRAHSKQTSKDGKKVHKIAASKDRKIEKPTSTALNKL